MGEVVFVLGTSVSVVGRCSRKNPLLRALSRYVARKSAVWSVGVADRARMSGLTCAVAFAEVGPEGPARHQVGPRAWHRINARIRGV